MQVTKAKKTRFKSQEDLDQTTEYHNGNHTDNIVIEKKKKEMDKISERSEFTYQQEVSQRILHESKFLNDDITVNSD